MTYSTDMAAVCHLKTLKRTVVSHICNVSMRDLCFSLCLQVQRRFGSVGEIDIPLCTNHDKKLRQLFMAK